jgi:hypothetical protein
MASQQVSTDSCSISHSTDIPLSILSRLHRVGLELPSCSRSLRRLRCRQTARSQLQWRLEPRSAHGQVRRSTTTSQSCCGFYHSPKAQVAPRSAKLSLQDQRVSVHGVSNANTSNAPHVPPLLWSRRGRRRNGGLRWQSETGADLIRGRTGACHAGLHPFDTTELSDGAGLEASPSITTGAI